MMNPLFKTLFAALACGLAGSPAAALATPRQVYPVTTEKTQLVYTVGEDGKLIFRYYGPRLHDVDQFSRTKGYNRPDCRREANYEAYPAFGMGYVTEPALSMVNADGSLITELVFEGCEQTTEAGVEHTVFTLCDRVQPLRVQLHVEAYQAEDVVAQWAVIENLGRGEVTLQRVYSSFMNFRANAYYLTHFYGTWASEMKCIEERLEPGFKVIESKKGIRTTQSENASFILSLDAPAQENSGRCIGGALAWSGNYKLSFEVDERDHLSLLAGINPFLSAYTLGRGERFETPKMIYTYSAEGQGEVSRNFHDWARKYSLHAGMSERPVLLNSWEGTYFDFDEKVLTDMMDDAAALGIELFVLDDGWFGNKYPRNSDKMGLGDWQVNSRKLPRGLQYLIDHAKSKGLKFGIWIEPEMVNPKSELAERHPDWIVQSPGREQITMRNQLLLDLTNPAVREFVWKVVDDLLTAHPDIAYIKWDANRHVEQVGSTHLPDDRQTHFWVDYTRGLYSIYQRIREKYPNVMLQACASGGGRVDYGSLQYHDEFWTSDNTDALQRIYMQYATNLIYPPLATASHVSASPGHQTGIITPLKFRFDVAMSGRLGMELQPKNMSETEKAFAREAIVNYKTHIRELVTRGDLYRLISPYACTNDHAANMLVSKDKSKAVLFAYCTGFNRRGVRPTMHLHGLDAAKHYRLTEINKISPRKSFWGDGEVFDGEYLKEVGVELQIARQYESAVFLIEEVK